MRACALLGATSLVLGAGACSGSAQEPVAVPDIPGAASTTGSPPSTGVPTTSGAGTGSSRVTVADGGEPTAGDAQAVLTGFTAFMDDWMAVAGSPTSEVPTSEHADLGGQQELEGVATTLGEAGNAIVGEVVVDDVEVSLAPGSDTALVTTCLDQSGTRLVRPDGTEAELVEEPRVVGSASMVRRDGAWLLTALDITGDPC